MQKKIVILRFTSLGDVLIFIPCLRQLALLNQNSHFTFITSYPIVYRMLVDLQNVHCEIINFKKTHIGIMGLYRVSQLIKNINPDYIVDIHNVLRTKIIKLFLIFSSSKILTFDKGRLEKKKIINRHFRQLNEVPKPQFSRYLETFEPIGLKYNISKVVDFVPYTQIRKKTRLESEIKIGIAPFAKHKAKTYSLTNIIEVINRISEKRKVTFFVFGNGNDEYSQAYNAFCNIKNVKILINKSETEEHDHLLDLNMMISMDSANAHLAALYQIPTIVIYGPTHPIIGFRPIGSQVYDITPDLSLYPELPVSIYGANVPKKWANIINSIPASIIIKKALDLI